MHALSNMHTHATAGNSFITEVTEHIAQCSLVALALNPSDESLQVSREKVNGHIYHMLKDGEITLPEPVGVMGCGCGVTHDTKWLTGIYCKLSWVRWGSLCCALLLSLQLSVLTEEQIRCTHFPDQEPSGTLPACSDIQDSSGGEEDLDPCGDDQEWGEQLGDVS